MNRQLGSIGHKQNLTSILRKGERELVVTRTFNASPKTVFCSWSQPALFQRWWVPSSVPGMSLQSCEMDVRIGGKYRLEFNFGGPDNVAFHGKYLAVVPDERIVWTNDEGEEGAITTVIFKGEGAQTLLLFHEAYPSKESLDEALVGSATALPEQFEQLDALLSSLTL
jgi:uncharacterized protein YndB with AHSA1/START domain